MDTNKTKLTLSCDKTLIEEAKKYAALDDDSISHIVSEFLESYISIHKNKHKRDNTIVQKIKLAKKYSGAFDFGTSRDYKKDFLESRVNPDIKK